MTEELFLDKKRGKNFFCLAHNLYLWISIDLSTAKSPLPGISTGCNLM